MNYFAKLLTVYFLLLSMFPCPEDMFCATDDTAAVTLTSTPVDDDCEDDCQPFCACCAVPMIRSCNSLSMNMQVQHSVYHSVIQTLSLSDIERPIWQPPQLS